MRPSSMLVAAVLLVPCTGQLPAPETEQATRVPSQDARRLLQKGAYEAAAASAQSALRRLLEQGRGDSLDAAACLEIRADALYRLGRSQNDEAQELAARAVELRTRHLGPHHPVTADALVVLADILRSRRQAEPARELYERALAIRRRAFGERSPESAAALSGLAGTRYLAGDFAGALPLYREVLAIREATLPPNHPDLGDALYNLGNVHRNLGEIDAARVNFEHALDVYEAAFGPDHIKVAGALNNLSLTLKSSGDWNGARTAMERAFGLYESSLGTQHPYVAGMLNNLANLAEKVGDSERALLLFRRSLDLREAVLGPDHPDVAQALNNLGDALRRSGRLAEARPLLERSLLIREKALGPEHPHVARTLLSLGRLLADDGDTAGGAALVERALAIQEAALGPGHREVAFSLNDLAVIEMARGRAARSEAIAERALATLAEAVGESHTGWAEAASTLARAALLAGDRDRAFDLSLRAESTARRHLELTASLLPKSEALSYAALRSRGRDLALQLLEDRRATRAERVRVWEAIAAARGAVLEALIERSARAAESADPATARLRTALDDATADLAAHLVHPPDGPPDDVRDQLDELRRRHAEAERALARASDGVNRRLDRRAVSLDRVRAALPPQASLVSFVRYRRFVAGRDDEAAYLAFVVGGDSPAPQVILLGSAAAIDDRVATWSREASSDPTLGDGSPTAALLAYREAGRSLRRAVWDPLLPALRGSSVVLVVGDGAVSLVNLSTLPVDRNAYLVERGPTIHRLGSERELLLLGGRPPLGRGLLALGPARVAPRVLVDPSFEGTTPAEFALEPLPGAEQEVEEIAATWVDAAGLGADSVTLLTGQNASEAAFKELAPGRRVVHIATHGFAGTAARAPAGTRGVGGLGAHTTLPGALLLEGASRLAGLLLAPDPPGAEDGEDGFVTTLEISLLDLGKVEWTVLSACSSGRGVLHASEGMLGLEWAFRAAGARTVVASLWPADDLATREWMNALYGARFGDGASTAEAVRTASRALLQRRRVAFTSHPYTWGAFVASGDWR